jgi:hypothetical protein
MMKSFPDEMFFSVRQAKKYFAFFCLVLADLAAVVLSFYVAFAIRAYVLTHIFTSAFLWQVEWRAFSSR